MEAGESLVMTIISIIIHPCRDVGIAKTFISCCSRQFVILTIHYPFTFLLQTQLLFDKFYQLHTADTTRRTVSEIMGRFLYFSFANDRISQ